MFSRWCAGNSVSPGLPEALPTAPERLHDHPKSRDLRIDCALRNGFGTSAPADQDTRRQRSLVMAKPPPAEKADKESARALKKEIPSQQQQNNEPPRDPARDSALS